jgi:ubiquinone/menaquinone biosynthesis C-methylase UbiE
MPRYTQYKYNVQEPEEGRPGLARRFFAWRYARYRQPEEYGVRRHELLAGLTGEVLEIGPGPGVNLEHLPAGARWVGLEPNVFMHERLRAAAAARGIEARFLAGTADAIPLPDASVDAVVGTLVLCSVGDQDRVLAEILRVLRPGGQYRFMEHVGAARGTGIRRLQDIVTPLWRRCQGGCRPNRETWVAIERAGFAKTDIGRFSVRMVLGMQTPHIVGTAVKGGNR